MFTASLGRNRRFRVVRRSRHRIVVAAGIITVMLPAGAAWAMWSAGGTGTGHGRGLTAVALTVTAGTPAADMFPGHAGAVVFTVTNPNPYPVTITSATTPTLGSVTALGTCATSNFTPSAGTISGTGIILANATTDITVVGALTMISAAPDACQGATVTLTSVLSGTQS